MPTEAMESDSPILIDLTSARLQLGPGQHVWMRSAFDTCLTALKGVAWVTFRWNADDFVIPAGQSLVVPRNRTALIGPLRGKLTLGARRACDQECLDRLPDGDILSVECPRWTGGGTPASQLRGLS